MLGAVALVIIFALVIRKPGHGPLPTGTPASFDSFTSDSKMFSCGYPSSWHLESNAFDSKKDQPFPMPASPVDFKMDMAGFGNGFAAFDINMDNMPSFLTPTTQSGPQKDDPQKVFTQLDRSMAQALVQNYKEVADRVVACTLGHGDVVEFTGVAGASGGESQVHGNVHGYCATFVTNGWHAVVTCSCPEAEWTATRPVFDEMIASLTPGPAVSSYVSHTISPP
ncbi:MAG TPA: hypothetical protein VFW40_08535 [Capsulimonadaceae bacterium]|nr:hypothetical protein [Capsulimonadaceae bacterium]